MSVSIPVFLVACGLTVSVQPAPSAPPSGIAQLAVGAPRDVVKLGGKGTRGVPSMVAWSPDGRQIYLRTSVWDQWGNENASHTMVDLDTARTSRAEEEPAWAARYWGWKSSTVSPADPKLKLQFEARRDLVKTTNVPREGAIGQSVSDPNATLDEVVQKAAEAAQMTRFETFTLRGRVIDQAINRRAVPGRMFSWAPAPHPFLAHVNERGRLVLVDGAGHTREVDGTNNVLLPAWRGDGTRIAFLQKSRGDSYTLRVFDVGLR